VTGAASADLLIAGPNGLPVAVTAFHVFDTLDAHENCFSAPETTPTQRDILQGI
jgi:hypothetical protein